MLFRSTESFLEENLSQHTNVRTHRSGKDLALIEQDVERSPTYDQEDEEDGQKSPQTDDYNELEQGGDSTDEDDERPLVTVKKSHVPMVPWFQNEEYTPTEMRNPHDYLDSDEHDMELRVKQEFFDKQSLQDAVRAHHIRADRTYIVTKSNKTQFIVECPVDGCLWRLRAAKRSSSGKWEITVNRDPHVCLVQMSLQDHMKLSSRIISNIVKPHVS